jgi:hypothetical protein
MTANTYRFYTDALEEESARFVTMAIRWTGWFGTATISWGVEVFWRISVQILYGRE